MRHHLHSFVVAMGLVWVGCAEQKVTFRNTAPYAQIVSPGDPDNPERVPLFEDGTPIDFEGMVSDAQENADALMVEWESSIDGVFYDDAADSTGHISFSWNLSVGEHAITLKATDGEGVAGQSDILIEVQGEDTDEPDTDEPDTDEPDTDEPDTAEPDTGEPAGSDPSISIDSPTDGSTFLYLAPVTISGLVWDDDQALETLEVSISSTVDGVLWDGFPNETGLISFETSTLTVGLHTIRVIVMDEDGNRDNAQVQIEVQADARPGVLIETPGDGEWYWTTDTIRLQGLVSDDVTDPQDLYISWESSIDGVLSRVPANPTGSTIVDTSLTAGIHIISLSAVDMDDNTSTYSVTVEIRDPLDHDGDLDGYSEREGDCDDFNPFVNPAAEEICDAYDNNCDGQINENFADSLEVNDSLSTATDLGRVDDGWIFSSADTESAGITLHTEGDEDWIRFDAGDDFLVDNVNIDVSVGSFSHTGLYVIELYALFDDDTVPVDVDIGYGRLSVQYEGDVFDGGEDDFALRIYADEWPGGSCGSRFEVEIVDM